MGWTKPKKLDIKCNKCKYYYRGALFGGGYNPFPYCHRFEDIGKRGNPLTCECFEKIKKLTHLHEDKGEK